MVTFLYHVYWNDFFHECCTLIVELWLLYSPHTYDILDLSYHCGPMTQLNVGPIEAAE